MKMKSIAALCGLSLAVISSSTVAASGDIRFVGAVTDVTCNVQPSVNGAVNNMVQLGTASLTTPATAVDFSLKSTGDAGCTSLVSSDVVRIIFSGPLNMSGLINQSGSATGAMVKIKSVNASADNSVDISQTSTSRSFPGSLFNSTTADGAKFTAQLVGGSAAGDYQSAVAFVVAYL